MKPFTRLLTIPLCLLLLSCCHKKDPTPLDQLPPITQTGANTIGFLFNGKPWTPSGYNGTSNYVVTYDPTYNGGSFDIAVYQLSNEKEEFFYIYSDSVAAEHTYPLVNPRKGSSTFRDLKKQCIYGRDSLVYRIGNLTITKLDKNKGIIAGTFEFTLAKPGCDTIKVTHGRFDKQF